MTTNNPFPKYIVDESSGQLIQSQHYQNWQAGYLAGIKELAYTVVEIYARSVTEAGKNEDVKAV